MFGLGLTLLWKPALLNSPLASVAILGGSLAVAAAVALLTRKK